MNWKQPTPLKNNKSALERSITSHLRYSLGKEWSSRKRGDLFLSLALTIRDRLIERMLESEARVHQSDAKRLYYLSMEFLMGRALGNNLYDLRIYETCKEALLGIGLDLEELREEEQDAALGNGGLGRLAACFLDSLATLSLPGYGYGIHYEYGLFKQEIYNGYQKEQ